MAVQDIIAAIDGYLAQLKAARNLLASPSLPSVKKSGRVIRTKQSQDQVQTKTEDMDIHPVKIPVRVIPPKNPRQRRARAKSSSSTPLALAAAVPGGPVIVRSADVARMRAVASDIAKPGGSTQSPQQQSLLDDLAKEVARRLNNASGF